MTDLNKTKLIIPTISVGNIPQLTADLILANDSNYIILKDDNIIDPDLLKFTYPFVSSDENKFIRSLEIYENKVNNSYLLQQRSPIIKGFEINFYSLLVKRIKQTLPQINEIIIIDSLSGSGPYIDLIKSEKVSNLYELINDQRISVGHLNPKIDAKAFESFRVALDNEIKSLAEKEKIEHKYDDINFEFKEVLPKTDQNVIQFDGSSFQNKIFVDSLLTKLVSTFVDLTTNINYFNMVSYEGDNSLDAVIFIKFLTSLKIVKPTENIKIPKSWESVYGFKHLKESIDESFYT